MLLPWNLYSVPPLSTAVVTFFAVQEFRKAARLENNNKSSSSASGLLDILKISEINLYEDAKTVLSTTVHVFCKHYIYIMLTKNLSFLIVLKVLSAQTSTLVETVTALLPMVIAIWKVRRNLEDRSHNYNSRPRWGEVLFIDFYDRT